MEQAGVVCLLLLLQLLLLGCLPRGVFGDGNNVRINNVNDFKTLVNDVNSGTKDYLGTTVLLDSDLSFSGETLGPIGPNDTHYFNGTFDGQGHIISDLKIKSSSPQFAGLFGYSTGLTIRNVVLDSSCSITSSFSGPLTIYIGGFIGYCYASSGQCNIENSVNMANVSFSGSITSNDLIIGGIAGRLYSSSSVSYVKNCANYGSVTDSGSSKNSWVGGIIGYLYGSSYTYVYNCLNYGSITHSGTTSTYLRLGGIAGYSNFVHIENCVSAGKISLKTTPSKSYIGSIVGKVNPYTFINYCYYTSESSGYDLYGYGTPSSSSHTLRYDSTTFKLSGTVSVGNYTGDSLISALNSAADYYILRDYSHWFLNKEEKSVKFIINSRASPITMDSQIILLPSLASEGNISFDGWYNDSECTYSLESFGITEDKTLYGRFEENTNNYTITFDTRMEGSSVAPITAQFGAVVQLPSDVTREHCSFAFWETEYGYNVGLSLTMPAHNFTLYAVWKCTHIKRIDDFVDFSKIVNSGTTNYSGTTVLLDSDLSFSGEGTLEPIGNTSSNYFLGVFDGQGHTISNLKMNTSSEYTGLFGYSKGLTIRNIALDSSCSITNSFSGSYSVYVGGIIGYCKAYEEQYNIENSVNMADVSFSGEASSSYSILGGIAGKLSSSSYSSRYLVYVKNCANYGSVTHSGASSYSWVGGIIGEHTGSFSSYGHLYNCLNYGIITHSGTTSSELRLGGISGYSNYAYIENCVSAGKISTQNTPSENSYIGSIVGYASYTSINYCYYTSDVGGYPINGTGTIINTTGTPTSATAVDSSLVVNLNNYASDNGWNEWLLNMNNASVTFKVNDCGGFALNSQVILLPTLAVNNGDDSGGGSSFVFSGWYSDPYYQDLFRPDEVTEGTTLYGVYGVVVTVTFDANGGNASATSKKVALNRTYGTLPEADRTGHMFVGWFTERTGGSEVTSSTTFTSLSSVTLHAHWSANNYTVTFDANGGDELAENKTTVIFNKTYGTLPEANRTGHMFVGWFTENNESVTNETIVTITTNHTLHAHWVANNYTVAFDANGGSVSEISRNATYNSKYGTLPEASRTGHMFVGWFTERTGGSEVTSSTTFTYLFDATLHAHWVANNYTVTFDANGGNELAVTSINATFNKTYGTLPDASRTGHMFVGWFTENNSLVTSETIVTTTTNHTLHAHWEKVTNQVEVVFNAKDLSKEDIEKFVKKYTNAEFAITGFEKGESGEVRVIITFKDAEKAENFVETIKESSDTAKHGIKKIGFIPYNDTSLSVRPSLLLSPLCKHLIITFLITLTLL